MKCASPKEHLVPGYLRLSQKRVAVEQKVVLLVLVRACVPSERVYPSIPLHTYLALLLCPITGLNGCRQSSSTFVVEERDQSPGHGREPPARSERWPIFSAPEGQAIDSGSQDSGTAAGSAAVDQQPGTVLPVLQTPAAGPTSSPGSSHKVCVSFRPALTFVCI